MSLTPKRSGNHGQGAISHVYSFSFFSIAYRAKVNPIAKAKASGCALVDPPNAFSVPFFLTFFLFYTTIKPFYSCNHRLPTEEVSRSRPKKRKSGVFKIPLTCTWLFGCTSTTLHFISFLRDRQTDQKVRRNLLSRSSLDARSMLLVPRSSPAL